MPVNYYEMRNRLVGRTISVIAENGLDKTTTNAIAQGSGINEAYIYRCFQNKEDLLAYVFDRLDEELFSTVMQNLPVLYRQDLELEDRWRIFFDAIWKFLLGNREKTLTFVRYYYSPYFKQYSVAQHEHRFFSVRAELKCIFKRTTDLELVLNYMLNALLDFAVRVHNGQVSNVDRYADHAFCVIYASVKQYFRKQRKEAV